MELAPGNRLGRYEIKAPIGAGGMGAVYRAHDFSLDRDVAIKVLPPEMSGDPQRRERLLREGRAVSALSHPNICALFDVGSENGIDFLVMELLDGESLAQRIGRGAMTLPQALRIAAEIASALDAAHRSGIVHRDLKPANVMLTRNGARLLDFGLAKVIETSVGRDASTALKQLTQEGAIVGTLRYMAPEQLEGRLIDARTDIFAFGVTLHEMLTGRQLFDGSTQTSIMSAILTGNPPPLRSLNPQVTVELERIVTRCLAKAPDDRWHSARDLAQALSWAGESPSHEALPAAPPSRSGRFPATLAAFVLIGTLAGVAAFALWQSSRAAIARPSGQLRFSVSPPPGTTFEQHAINSELAVSPDGRGVALVASESNRSRLYLRSFDSLAARAIEGTEDAISPFWSPDGKWIGFFANGSMKKVLASGGPVETICEAPGASASWGRDGRILFSVWGPGSSEALQIVDEQGGTPRSVTDDAGWHVWPFLLEDGKHFLCHILPNAKRPELRGGLYFGSLAGGPLRPVPQVNGRAELRGRELFYCRDGALVRQAIDLASLRLEGDPITISDSVYSFVPLGTSNFSTSADGSVVAYQRAALASQLVWRDRNGKELARVGKPELYRWFSLSRDGSRLAAEIFDRATGAADVWLFEPERGVSTRLTSNPVGVYAPLWIHGGDRLIASAGVPAEPSSAPQLAVLSLDGRIIRVLSKQDGPQRASDITVDDSEVLYTVVRGATTAIEILPTSGTGKRRPISTGGSHNESNGVLSPDQRWIAFEADDSGRPEVYVRPFGRDGERLRVSTDGAFEPQWDSDGSGLLYIAASGLLVEATLDLVTRPRVVREAALFHIGAAGMMGLAEFGQRYYAVANDRILVREIPGGVDADPVSVVINDR